MAVDHYEVEYDEPLLANVAAELGTDFATALSTNDHLTTPLQQALVRTSRVAARERREFESLVQSELDSLDDADTRLRNTAEAVAQARDRDFTRRPVEAFEAGTQQLQTAKQECESVIMGRQAEYVKEPIEDGLSFREYLYQQHRWTHPVVCDALDLISHARKVEEQIATLALNRL